MTLEKISIEDFIDLTSPYHYILVTSNDKQDKPNIIGLAWWTFVSLSPPTLIIAVGYERYSYECLKHSQEFVLCSPSTDQKEGAWFCATKSGRTTDKFKETGFIKLPAVKVKPPIIDGCTAALECKITDEIKAHDHAIFVAEVVAIHGDKSKSNHLYSMHFYSDLGGLDSKTF